MLAYAKYAGSVTYTNTFSLELTKAVQWKQWISITLLMKVSIALTIIGATIVDRWLEIKQGSQKLNNYY